MTQQTKIEWTDFTVNFWEGCQKVGPGCDHCYAEARDTRFTGGKHWGPGAPRRKVKGGIAKLRKINRDADKFHAEHGHWPRVFCSSLSDVFDNAVDRDWRVEAFKELTAATNTRPQLLTKRIGNVFQMIPPAWAMKWPAHVGLMITVVNQDEADRDIPKLLALKARLGIPWVGLSMEPLLGPVDLERVGNLNSIRASFPDVVATEERHIRPEPISGFQINVIGTRHPGQGVAFYQTPNHMGGFAIGCQRWPHIDWVIVGGESGHNARPTHPDWIRSLRDQCEAAGTPFLFKQWGEWAPGECCHHIPTRSERIATWWNDTWSFDCLTPKASEEMHYDDAPDLYRIGKARAGRLLDGRTWDGVPT